jgi:gliding motility-associated-like protein
MIKKIISVILLMAVFATAFSQNQNSQWRFGNAGAMDFNTLPPNFVNDCVIATPEGSASVADRLTGSLLFYTDGVTVWDASNQVMPNGTGLLGGVTLSSTTAAVIVPKPGNSNLYYIITVDEFTSNNGVRYSVVDMSLNGGLGDIVADQKNIFLFQTSEERLEVVPASDGQSYWLLTHNNLNSSFYSFRINNAGIQNTPVVSSVGSANQINQGHIKINKQFNKIAMGISDDSDIELFDFDNATGIFSNPITLNFNLLSVAYGIEFSPDGKLLYFSDGYSIFQLDLTQTTPQAIQNSAYQVSITQGGVLQLGIDDKIYVASNFSIDAINCPNKLGATCGYQTNVVATGPTWGGSSTLPKWVYYPNETALPSSNSIVYSDSCFGGVTQFSIQNTIGISSVSWNFGDLASGTINNTSISLTPQHTYTAAGTYNVSVLINYACYSVSLPLTLNIDPTVNPTFNFIPSFCAGATPPILPMTSSNGLTGTWFPALVDTSSSGIYTFTPDPGTCVNTTPVQITINVDPVVIPTFAAVPAFCSGTTAPTLPTTSLNGFSGVWVPASVSNVSSGSYTFTPTAVAGQCLSDAVLSITVLNQLAPDFVDLSLCQNQIGYVLANQSPNGITGTWSPATIDFTTGGNYTFTPNSGQCASPQTIAVSINSSNLNDFQWVVSAPFSSNATITVIPNSPGNYLYQLDLGAQQTSNIFQNVSAGLHSIQVVDANGCSNTVIKEDILIIDYPKFFTPNDDGFTDTWNISGLQSQALAKIFIYDRFGKLIKQISPSQTGWDGAYNNRPLPADDYWFVVEYEYNNSFLQFSSHFSLKR